MGLNIRQLLELRTWRAFDVDDEGRVLAGSDESGSIQLVELSPDGMSTELTAVPGGCSGRYLAGERAIVVQHGSEGNELEQLSLLRIGEPGLEPFVHDPKYFHRLVAVLPGRIAYTTNRRNGVDSDVVVRNLSSGDEETIYHGGGWVSEAVPSPNNRFVALSIMGKRPKSEQIILVDTMSETDRVVALTDVNELARHISLHWLPDSSGFIVTTNQGRDLNGIARYELTTGIWTWLITSDQHDLEGWLSPDGTKLLVMANDNGSSVLNLYDAQTGEHRHEIGLPDTGWVSPSWPAPAWSPSSRFLALSFTNQTTPGDVLLADTENDNKVTPLTDSRSPLQGADLPEPTVHWIEDRIPAFCYGKGSSAVLLLHGGPAGQSTREFNPLVHGLVAVGHTVVVPNIRGSIGYGKRYYSADDVRKRPESFEDLAAVHDWLPSIGVDKNRVALWGTSYGGYLVLVGLTFQPERWAAGVDIVGISSMVTFLENTARYRRAHRESEYGSLKNDRDFLLEISPLYKTDAIRSPLFLIHGKNDPRVPVTEAYQIADVLQSKGIVHELLVYPDEGHVIANRNNKLDAYSRAIEFLSRHLA